MKALRKVKEAFVSLQHLLAAEHAVAVSALHPDSLAYAMHRRHVIRKHRAIQIRLAAQRAGTRFSVGVVVNFSLMLQ